MTRRQGIFATAMMAAAALLPFKAQAQDAARAEQVRIYSEQIDDLITYSDLTAGWRIDQFREKLEKEARKTAASESNGNRRVLVKLKTFATSPVAEAAYNTVRKYARDGQAVELVRLTWLFSRYGSEGPSFQHFSVAEATRHVAQMRKDMPADRNRAFKSELCALALGSPTFSSTAMVLARFEKSYNTPPRPPGELNIEFGDMFGVKRPAEKPVCGS